MVIEKQLHQYKGRRVLVTGHTGFKGSWLSILLRELGAEVIGLALDPKTEKDNFVLAGVSKIVKDIRFDIRDKDKILQLFQKEQPEMVFHLAAQPLVLEAYQKPLETFETNILGTANILDAIRQTKSVTTAVFITTDKVYENKEWLWPYREDESLGGYDPYSASKGASEFVISSYRDSYFNPKNFQEHGVSIASVRAGNVIGGGDWAENRIIPDCIKALEEGKEIEVRNPRAIRPWQHVLEPLFGYLILGAKMMEYPMEYGEAWNFGPEHSNVVDVEELVNLIIRSYGSGSWKDISTDKAKHEANYLALDINKAKYRLNWKPVLNIEETIDLTIDWYRKYQDGDVLKLCEDQIAKFIDLWKLRNEN